MGIRAFITDGLNRRLQAHVHLLSGEKSQHAGLLTLTDRFRKFDPEFHPFLSDTFGVAMNQNIAFTGQPTVIHAGVNSGALLTGTTTGTTASHLIDSGETFANIAVGHSVKNTTSGNEYALVTAVASNDLTLDSDIMVSGENYEINPIWVGTAVQGTWNFADGGKVTLTSANDNDEATFDNDVGQLWNMANHTTLTGKVDLDTFNDNNHTIIIQFDLDNTPVGNSVNLNDFIDTGDLSEQSFVIPKASLGLTTQNINGMSVRLERTGGQKPTFKLDDIQWEETGAAEVYKATTPQGTTFHITEIRIAIADNITGITTVAGATENATIPNLSFDALLGVSALTNGILFSRVRNGKVAFAVSIKQLGDFLSTGSNIIPGNRINDGTNMFIALVVKFPEPIVLEGGSDNFLSFTIQDDLSGLLQFTAAARGALEV